MSNMAGVNNLSLLSTNHLTHNLGWMVTHINDHRLLCLLCACDLLEDPAVPVIKKRFLLSEVSSFLKESSETVIEIFTNHERFTWHFVDVVFEIVHQSSEHLCQISADVLLEICCQLQSDDLVYGLMQKILTKINDDIESHQCVSLLSLMKRLIDSIPALTDTLLDGEGGLMDLAVQSLSSNDDSVVCAVLSLLNSLFGSSSAVVVPQSCLQGIWRKLFPVVTGTQNQNVIQNAVDLMKTFSEIPEYVGVVSEAAFSLGQQTLPAVIKKVLHTRKENLQISAVQIIGQALSNSKNLPELAQKFLDADLAEFFFEQLSTTNKILLNSIFCSLLLLTESETFFSKCHSVLGIDSILRSTEQCLAVNYLEALHFGLQLLCVILEKHPPEQKLISGSDMFKHSSVMLTQCVQLSDAKIIVLGMKCLHHLFRVDYLPIPLDFSELLAPVNAVVRVLKQFPKPLVRGTKRNLPQSQNTCTSRSLQQSTKLAKQEEAILNAVQLLERAFSLASGSKESLGLYDESQFTAPSKEGNIGDSNHGDSPQSFTQQLLAIFDREIIPIVMINYELFKEVALPLFGSFLRTLCHCLEADVTLDFSKKLVSSSFIQWAMEVKSKYYSDSSLLIAAVDDFISLLCFKLLALSSPSDAISLSLKAALHQAKDIKSFGDLLAVDPEGINSMRATDQSDASIMQVQDGCLAVLYCAWLYDDKILEDDALMEKLSCLMMHRTESSLSGTSLRHILFLLAGINHSDDLSIQIHGTSTLLRLMRNTPSTSVYTHHKQVLKWCFTCPGMSSKLALEMLELWMKHLAIPDDETEQIDKEEDLSFFIQFVATTPLCLTAMLQLFINSASNEMTEKVLRVLQILFTESSNTEALNIAAVATCVLEKLPELQQQVLLSEEKHENKGSPQFFNFLKLVTTVYCQAGQVAVSLITSSDLKLIFHAIKLMSKSDGECDPSAEEILLTMNFFTSVLLRAMDSKDSRVTSMMISSEPLLNCLHLAITENKTKQTDGIFVTQKKVKYQSLYIVAILVKSCAQFKLKPGLLMKFDINVILGSLLDKDICVKVISLQFLTALLELEFGSQLVQLLHQHQQQRREEDIGLGVSAATIRSLFFHLHNMILQGSDFLSWNSVQCLSSLLKYVCKTSKQLYDQLIQQPWNEFLINSCIQVYGDNCPSPWLFQLFALFPSSAKWEEIQSLLNAAMEQSTAGVDQRLLTSVLMLLHQEWNQMRSNQKFVNKTKQWLERIATDLIDSEELRPLEMLLINDTVITADLTQQSMPSPQRMLENVMRIVSSS